MPLEAGYAHIDDVFTWAEKHGLAVVLDVHEAPGFTLTNDLEADSAHKNVLFDTPEVQDRFVALWETIARRYAGVSVPVIFELLNEVTLPVNDAWNPLAERLHAAIRAIAPTVPIMIGGTHNNAVRGLEGLAVVDDPQFAPLYADVVDRHLDRAYLEGIVAPAVEFSRRLISRRRR